MRGFRRPRQGEKGTRLVHGLAKPVQVLGLADEVEQIAMLAGRGIRLMFNCT